MWQPAVCAGQGAVMGEGGEERKEQMWMKRAADRPAGTLCQARRPLPHRRPSHSCGSEAQRGKVTYLFVAAGFLWVELTFAPWFILLSQLLGSAWHLGWE